MHYNLKKQYRSFGYAFKGLRSCIGKEQNLGTHLLVAVAVLAAGWLFGISRGEWIAVILCIGIVIGAELINSAIERVVDLASPDYHPLAGQAKDIAAGAVLIVAIAAAAVGLIVFLPYIF